MDRSGIARVIGRRVPIADLAAGERRVEGAIGHYLTRVLRLRKGDAFVAFDPKTAHEADALTLRVDGNLVTVVFENLRVGKTRAHREVTWVQGLAKGDKCDAIVRDATELGATRIVMTVTERSVVKLDSPRAQARRVRWAKIVEEAARQCGRSDPPVIDPPGEWSQTIAQVGQEYARFCLWDGASEPLGPALFEALTEDMPLAFACGPEGGLSSGEIERATELGWKAAFLGPLTLRTETVAAAVLGAVSVWNAVR